MIKQIWYGELKGKPVNYARFVCDTESDLSGLPTSTTAATFGVCGIGSEAYCLATKGTYILNNSNVWSLFGENTTSGGTTSTYTAGAGIEISEDNVISATSESFSGSYNDLTDKPALFSGSYNDLTNKPTIFSGSYNDLTNKPTLFSGSYNDLTDKPVATTYTAGTGIEISDDNVISATGGGSGNSDEDDTIRHIKKLDIPNDYVYDLSYAIEFGKLSEEYIEDYLALGLNTNDLFMTNDSNNIYSVNQDIDKNIESLSQEDLENLQNDGINDYTFGSNMTFTINEAPNGRLYAIVDLKDSTSSQTFQYYYFENQNDAKSVLGETKKFYGENTLLYSKVTESGWYKYIDTKPSFGTQHQYKLFKFGFHYRIKGDGEIEYAPVLDDGLWDDYLDAYCNTTVYLEIKKIEQTSMTLRGDLIPVVGWNEAMPSLVNKIMLFEMILDKDIGRSRLVYCYFESSGNNQKIIVCDINWDDLLLYEIGELYISNMWELCSNRVHYIRTPDNWDNISIGSLLFIEPILDENGEIYTRIDFGANVVKDGTVSVVKNSMLPTTLEEVNAALLNDLGGELEE